LTYAATPSTTLTISNGVYPGAPSYTFSKLGSTYYAKDQNGYIEYQGTSLINCFQFCHESYASFMFLDGILHIRWVLVVDENYTTISCLGKVIIYGASGVNLFNVTGHNTDISNLF